MSWSNKIRIRETRLWIFATDDVATLELITGKKFEYNSRIRPRDDVTVDWFYLPNWWICN